jgi:hypothetical protein
MSKRLTASDRTRLIRLASELPEGSEERRAILAGIVQSAMKKVKIRVEKDVKGRDGGVLARRGQTLKGEIGRFSVDIIFPNGSSALIDIWGEGSLKSRMPAGRENQPADERFTILY